MIGFFPSPYPDESFYSLCARYADRVHYPSRLALIRELTGAVNPIQFDGMPSRLDYFFRALPPAHRLSVNLLIENHTLFPVYAAFWSRERSQRVRVAMRTGNRVKVDAIAGLAGSRIRPPERLRYCPQCHKDDRERYGEAYWHRLHQMPGVEVCSRHKAFLEESLVERRTTGRWSSLTTAEEGASACGLRVVDESNYINGQLLAIARDVEWLLESCGRGMEVLHHRNRYLSLLVSRRLATWNGRLRGREIVRSIKNHYAGGLLDRLQCTVESEDRKSWILRLLHGSRMHSAHPIHHILVVHWLGLDIKTFLNLSPKVEPFGSGPWPCLNPAKPHKNNLLIQYVEWHSSRRGPVGVFECKSCGFLYLRKTSQPRQSHRTNIGKVVTYGEMWDKKLRILWNNPSVELKAIQAELGVSFATVRRQAKRLALPVLRTGGRISLKSSSALRLDWKEQSHTERLKQYQLRWLKLQTDNRTIGRTELAQRYPKLKAFLYRHAKEWLLLNQPPRKIRRDWPSTVNWQRRDKEFAKEIQRIVSELGRKGATGKPLSLYAIRGFFCLSGRYCLTQKYRSKLPRTFAVLSRKIKR